MITVTPAVPPPEKKDRDVRRWVAQGVIGFGITGLCGFIWIIPVWTPLRLIVISIIFIAAGVRWRGLPQGVTQGIVALGILGLCRGFWIIPIPVYWTGLLDCLIIITAGAAWKRGIPLPRSDGERLSTLEKEVRRLGVVIASLRAEVAALKKAKS